MLQICHNNFGPLGIDFAHFSRPVCRCFPVAGTSGLAPGHNWIACFPRDVSAYSVLLMVTWLVHRSPMVAAAAGMLSGRQRREWWDRQILARCGARQQRGAVGAVWMQSERALIVA
jgi:hypothetical protein